MYTYSTMSKFHKMGTYVRTATYSTMKMKMCNAGKMRTYVQWMKMKCIHTVCMYIIQSGLQYCSLASGVILLHKSRHDHLSCLVVQNNNSLVILRQYELNVPCFRLSQRQASINQVGTHPTKLEKFAKTLSRINFYGKLQLILIMRDNHV